MEKRRKERKKKKEIQMERTNEKNTRYRKKRR